MDASLKALHFFTVSLSAGCDMCPLLFRDAAAAQWSKWCAPLLLAGLAVLLTRVAAEACELNPSAPGPVAFCNYLLQRSIGRFYLLRAAVTAAGPLPPGGVIALTILGSA